MTGYPRKKRLARPAALLMMVSVCSFPVTAGDDSLPAMELLEFLADWETTDGRWVDPLELEELPETPVPVKDESDAEVSGK